MQISHHSNDKETKLVDPNDKIKNNLFIIRYRFAIRTNVKTLLFFLSTQFLELTTALTAAEIVK